MIYRRPLIYMPRKKKTTEGSTPPEPTPVSIEAVRWAQEEVHGNSLNPLFSVCFNPYIYPPGRKVLVGGKEVVNFLTGPANAVYGILLEENYDTQQQAYNFISRANKLRWGGNPIATWGTPFVFAWGSDSNIYKLKDTSAGYTDPYHLPFSVDGYNITDTVDATNYQWKVQKLTWQDNILQKIDGKKAGAGWMALLIIDTSGLTNADILSIVNDGFGAHYYWGRKTTVADYDLGV